jgi:hypothetical protein
MAFFGKIILSAVIKIQNNIGSDKSEEQGIMNFEGG